MEDTYNYNAAMVSTTNGSGGYKSEDVISMVEVLAVWEDEEGRANIRFVTSDGYEHSCECGSIETAFDYDPSVYPEYIDWFTLPVWQWMDFHEAYEAHKQE